MMIIENKYEIGQKVYLVTDTEQHERLVTAIRVMPGSLIYQTCFGTIISEHYDFEISAEKNLQLTWIQPV